jgi:amino acid permease
MTLGIIIPGWIIAACVKNLSIVLGFVGATGSTTICYILPAALYWKIGTNRVYRVIGLALGLFGICFLLLSVTVQILELAGVPL